MVRFGSILEKLEDGKTSDICLVKRGSDFYITAIGKVETDVIVSVIDAKLLIESDEDIYVCPVLEDVQEDRCNIKCLFDEICRSGIIDNKLFGSFVYSYVSWYYEYSKSDVNKRVAKALDEVELLSKKTKYSFYLDVKTLSSVLRNKILDIYGF